MIKRMANRKQKQKPLTLTTMGFVGRWTATYVLGWVGLLATVLVLLPLIYVLVGAMPLWLGLVSWGSVAVGRLVGERQEYLLQQKFQVAPAGWQRLSGGAWFFLGIGLALVIAAGSAANTAIFAAIFALPAIAQAYLLRNSVPQAWLWVLAAAASGLIFGLPLAAGLSVNPISVGLTLGLGGVLHGAVMAMTLVWMFNLLGIQESHEEVAHEDDNIQHYPHLQVPEEQVLDHDIVRDHISRLQQRRGR